MGCVMRYSELLVKLYDVVLKLKKQNKEDYVPSDLFCSMKDVLYLEYVLEPYYSRESELNDFESQCFKELIELHSKAKAKLEKSYVNAYFNGEVKRIFLRQYKDTSDYIAIGFITEIGDDLFSSDFTKLFNQNIRNVYEERPDILSKLKVFSYKYGELSISWINIGMIFKGLLKEMELLSKLYRKNSMSGLEIYSFCNSLLSNNDGNLKLVRQIMPVDSDFSFTTNLTDLFLKLEDSYDFFSEKYMPLFLNINSKYGAIDLVIMNKVSEESCILGLILNKLTDKEFLNSIMEEDGSLNFDKISSMINIIMDKGVKDIREKHKIKDMYNYYKMADDIFEKFKEGNLKSEGKNKK